MLDINHSLRDKRYMTCFASLLSSSTISSICYAVINISIHWLLSNLALDYAVLVQRDLAGLTPPITSIKPIFNHYLKSLIHTTAFLNDSKLIKNFQSFFFSFLWCENSNFFYVFTGTISTYILKEYLILDHDMNMINPSLTDWHECQDLGSWMSEKINLTFILRYPIKGFWRWEGIWGFMLSWFFPNRFILFEWMNRITQWLHEPQPSLEYLQCQYI